MTWDGQPAGEMAAAIEAVIAAAWCAGRDAAAAVCREEYLAEDTRVRTEPDTDKAIRCAAKAGKAAGLEYAIRVLTPPPDLVSTLRPGGAPSHPERIAAAAIEAAAEREIGQPRGALAGVGKIAVEAISAVELVIVPAERMAQLLELERAMRGPVAAIAAERQRQIETERSENPTRRQAGAHIPTEADVLHNFNSPTADVLAEVAAERRRQQEAEGWTLAHDDMHVDGEMARAAAVYALNSAGVVRLQFNAELAEIVPRDWPWSLSWYRPAKPRRALVKAGALIVAEIERIDRAAVAEKAAPHG